MQLPQAWPLAFILQMSLYHILSWWHIQVIFHPYVEMNVQHLWYNVQIAISLFEKYYKSCHVVNTIAMFVIKAVNEQQRKMPNADWCM